MMMPLWFITIITIDHRSLKVTSVYSKLTELAGTSTRVSLSLEKDRFIIAEHKEVFSRSNGPCIPISRTSCIGSWKQ